MSDREGMALGTDPTIISKWFMCCEHMKSKPQWAIQITSKVGLPGVSDFLFNKNINDNLIFFPATLKSKDAGFLSGSDYQS